MSNAGDYLNFDPSVFQDVHARIGIALWRCQEFEYVLCYFIALILKMPPSRAEAEAREILEKLRTKTLGQLCKELSKGVESGDVPHFEARLEAFLKERNWLVHHSYREHGLDLFNPAKIRPLLARLDRITEEAGDLQRAFKDLATPWVLSQGVDPSHIQAGIQKILGGDAPLP